MIGDAMESGSRLSSGKYQAIQGLLLLALTLGLSACSKPAPPEMPAPVVTVTKPAVQDVTLYYYYTGTTAAVEDVEIRARVSGFVEKIHFQPSTQVQKGDLLFEIEHEPYEIAVNAAKAELQSAEAVVEERQSIFDKINKAFERNAATEAEVIEAQARLDQAKASVLMAKASLQDAELQLSYTYVRSPLTGRVSRNLVDEGDLVGTGEPTLLTRVVKLDPIWCYFDVSERIVLEYLERRGDDELDEHKDVAELALASDPEGVYPYVGRLDFVDNQVDGSTGTILVRGVFDNKDKQLFPGLFARVRAPYDVLQDAVVVREDAIGTDLAGKYVLTVNAENIVVRTGVELGPRVGVEDRVILTGLAADQMYISVGIQRAQPGLPVTPEVAQAKPTPAETETPAPDGQGDAETEPSAPDA